MKTATRIATVSRALIAFGIACAAFPGHARAEDASPASRQGGCNNSDLRGNYGFSARGTTLNGVPIPSALLGPFASAGSATYDGEGHVSLTAMASFNGVVQPAAASGTYQVGPDCIYTSSLDNGTTFRGVIANNRQELFILQTSPATVIAGTAQKLNGTLPRAADLALRPARCMDKSVRGSYAFIAEGFAGPPTVPPESAGPLAGVGTVAYEADGSFLLNAQRSVNGTLDPAPLALGGKYEVDRDCSITMDFDVGFHFSGVVSNGGKDIGFVETDPGTTLLVKAKRM